MAGNKEKILSFYKEYEEDHRASTSRAENLEFHYTKKLLDEYINGHSHVIEIGCATGHYGMYFSERCAHYTGVDLVQEHIDAFKQKIRESGKQNITAVVGDATDLSMVPRYSYDIVFCLGPMYHLPREERLKVFDECYRIAKDGAILAFAYINRIGAYIGACIHDDLRNVYPNEQANRNVFSFSTDFFGASAADDGTGVFHYTSPEEMAFDAKQKSLKILKNCGLDFFFAQCAINQMSEEQFQHYLEIADKMCESPSCTGLSDHALLICKK